MTLLHDGPLRALPDAARRALLDRRASFEPFVDAVRPLRDAVRARGDAALRELTEKFDGVRLDRLETPRSEAEAAFHRLPRALQDALRAAWENVDRYHRTQLRETHDVEVVPGLRAGRRHVPLARAGAYVPGGRAAYPSTVLMTVTPAKAAGVPEVVVCTPPGPDGRIPDATLAACHVARADRIFPVGGAQAVFAMAYGTESVPRCDKVVGPGNAYVAAAKSLVAGDVGIDSPAGPSEVLVLHTGSAPGELARDARFAVAEVVAQAEHDPETACVLVSTSEEFLGHARARLRELREGADAPARRDVVAASLAKRGAFLHAEREEAFAFSEAFGPEHLVILGADPRGDLVRLANYGSAFLGPWSSVALGDYCAGPNHVLPTAGLSRSYSGLSVDDFLRRPTHQEATREGLARLAPVAEALAALEGLPNHAAALRTRREAL